MTFEQIDRIFKLISKSKPTARENIRTFYLDRIDESIIDFCVRHFETEKRAEIRCDYLRFTLEYAKTEKWVTDFAEKALTDRSKMVRKKALSIFAFSLNSDFLKLLESQRGKLKGNEEDIENAIKAIKCKNHNLFYPAYDTWTITRADKNRHLNKQQFKEDIQLYIEKYAKEAVPELKNILDSLYD